jgi:hypothetical protein
MKNSMSWTFDDFLWISHLGQHQLPRYSELSVPVLEIITMHMITMYFTEISNTGKDCLLTNIESNSWRVKFRRECKTLVIYHTRVVE